MFDDGKIEVSLYKVDLQNCVFILTSNFSDRNEILNGVGMPIYSRIDEKIKFKPLNIEQKRKLISQKFDQILSDLKEEDKNTIENSGLKEQYLDNADAFHNLRMLDKIIETNVYRCLMDIKLNELG